MTDTCSTQKQAHACQKYFEFLSALYQTRGADRKPILLEAVDQRLLEIIAVQHFLNKPLSVMQLLNSREILFLGASTISRKLDVLITDGWIRTETDTADRRMKLVVPTEQAMGYFAQLNALMPQ